MVKKKNKATDIAAKTLKFESTEKSEISNSQVEEKFFGIQRYNNPTDAWHNMSDFWGEKAYSGQSRIYILNDEKFEKVIYARIIRSLWEKHFGVITDKECKKRLNINGMHNDYLLDFNYFHYSETTDRYYTSRMDFKDDHVYMFCERQWRIYDELMKIHNVLSLISKAKRFFKKKTEELYDYEKDSFEEFLFINELEL